VTETNDVIFEAQRAKTHNQTR